MLFMFLLSCVKSFTPETLMGSENCLLALKQKLEDNGCTELNYLTQDYSDALIRCHRKDIDRRNIWDTNWFRMSPIEMTYGDGEIGFVESHTICVDGTWRVESYDPNEIAFDYKK